jgi:Raf kinase inhibitor-like YbhB/YbcL family protein
MRNITLSAVILVLIACAAFTPVKTLVVTSTAFTQNGAIPVKYTCLGQQASPPLNIANIPAEARSLAIIVDDPDGAIKTAPPAANTSLVSYKTTKITHKKRTAVKQKTVPGNPIETGYTNWLIWNIDIDNFIPENFKNSNEGMNSANQVGYVGLCPQSGTHNYHFRVFALDTKLNIPKNSTKADLEKVMQGHILAKGELVGIFNKTYR